MKLTGVSGEPLQRWFFQPLGCQVGKTYLQHSFLYKPQCPTPLFRRDLLNELNTHITFLSA